MFRFSPSISLTLQLLTAVFWTAAYAFAIRRSLLDRTTSFPAIAVGLNLTWELLFVFRYPQPGIQGVVNIAWLIFDLVLAWTTVSFASSVRVSGGFELPVAVWFPGLVALSYLVNQGLTTWSSSYDGGLSAFVINLAMSAAFVWMALNRRDAQGQSVLIAVLKLLGSLASAIEYQQYLSDYWPVGLFLAILVLDVWYIVLIGHRQRTARIGMFARI